MYSVVRMFGVVGVSASLGESRQVSFFNLLSSWAFHLAQEAKPVGGSGLRAVSTRLEEIQQIGHVGVDRCVTAS